MWMLGLGMEMVDAFEPDTTSSLVAFLFLQGVLDEQFVQLVQLQDESSPNFVFEVINIYFKESGKLLNDLRTLVYSDDNRDDDGDATASCNKKKRIGIHLNRLMGSSSSIGANRVRNVCIAFREAAECNNIPGCQQFMEALEHEYCYLKSKLQQLFQVRAVMEQRRVMMALASMELQ